MNVVEFVVDGRLSGERTHRDVVEFVAVEVRSDAHPVVIGLRREPDREVVAVTASSFSSRITCSPASVVDGRSRGREISRGRHATTERVVESSRVLSKYHHAPFRTGTEISVSSMRPFISSNSSSSSGFKSRSSDSRIRSRRVSGRGPIRPRGPLTSSTGPLDVAVARDRKGRLWDSW